MNALMGQIVLNKHVLRNTLRFYSSRVSLSSSKQVSEAGAVLLAAGPTTFWRPMVSHVAEVVTDYHGNIYLTLRS